RALSTGLASLQPFERFEGLPTGRVLYLLDRSRAVLAGLEHPMAISKRGMPAIQIAELINAQDRSAIDAKGGDGIDRFYAIMPISSGDLFILVGLPRSELSGWFHQDLPIQLTGIVAM